MISLLDLQKLLAEKQELLKDKAYTLNQYTHDPLAYFEDEITTDHDNQLAESYAHILDQLPFYVCRSGASWFAEFVKECDNSFYSQSLNDYADSYDVSNLDEYKELESEIEDLESEIFDLESEIEDLESFSETNE